MEQTTPLPAISLPLVKLIHWKKPLLRMAMYMQTALPLLLEKMERSQWMQQMWMKMVSLS